MPCTCAFRPPARALRVGFLFVLLLAIGPAMLLAATLPPTMLRLTGDTVTEGFANQACAAGDVNGDGYRRRHRRGARVRRGRDRRGAGVRLPRLGREPERPWPTGRSTASQAGDRFGQLASGRPGT